MEFVIGKLGETSSAPATQKLEAQSEKVCASSQAKASWLLRLQTCKEQGLSQRRLSSHRA